MKKNFTLALIMMITAGLFNVTQAQTVYATVASGNWSDATVWETYSTFAAALAASPGGGTAATSTPSGTHNVVIRAGHTISMNGANRGCKGIIINSGGKLWANEATARRLQIGAGGTGFTYPLVDTVTVNGTLGGANDGVFIEVGTNAQLVKVSGTGSIDILRIRCAGANTGQNMTIDIDANINLWQSANYALSLVYNPNAADNYTMNIKPGKTVTIKTADGYFHNSQNSATYGKYTYNIQGTLDLSSNTQTTNSLSASIIAPAPATSSVTVNVDGGTFKSGAGIKLDTSTAGPVSAGVLDFNVINGGMVDLTAASYVRVGKTADAAGSYYDMFFGLDATGSVKKNVDVNDFKFPVGINTATSQNYCRIANSGTTDIHTVSLKSTFDNAPADPTKVVNRQWTVAEATAGGSNDTIRLSWVTADQAASFNPAASVYVMHWTGSAWEYLTASVSGSGTMDDPYQAKAFTGANLGIFGVTNFTPVPLKILSFTGALKNNKSFLSWSTTNQVNVSHFTVEESKDGLTFNTIGTVNATDNNAVNNYTFAGANILIGQAYYRIKIVDKDGRFEYSSIVVIKNNIKNNLIIAGNVITDNRVNLVVADLASGIYQLAVVSANGQQVQRTSIGHNGGQFNTSIVINHTLNSGMYYVLLSGNGITQKANFIVP